MTQVVFLFDTEDYTAPFSDDAILRLAELLRSEVICDALGDHALAHFYELKEIEWDMYRTQIHEWERDQYLSLY